jgi:hypothetical protein
LQTVDDRDVISTTYTSAHDVALDDAKEFKNHHMAIVHAPLLAILRRGYVAGERNYGGDGCVLTKDATVLWGFHAARREKIM